MRHRRRTFSKRRTSFKRRSGNFRLRRVSRNTKRRRLGFRL